MSTLLIQPSGHTKSLLIALYSSNNNQEKALSLINNENDKEITAYMFSSAISGCGTNYPKALELLQKACLLNRADEAVFTATAKCCAKNKKYLKSFKIIDAMLLRGMNFNKYSFSFIINAVLEYIILGNDVIKLLEKYLILGYESNQKLITSAVCQKVVRDLLIADKPLDASR